MKRRKRATASKPKGTGSLKSPILKAPPCRCTYIISYGRGVGAGTGYTKAKHHCFCPALIYKYPLALLPQLGFMSGLGAGHFFVQLAERGKHVASAVEAIGSISPSLYGGSTPTQVQQ